MRDERSSTSSVLLEEKRRLEVQNPSLVKGYQRFLKDFAGYQAVQRQFDDDWPAESGLARRPSLMARRK